MEAMNMKASGSAKLSNFEHVALAHNAWERASMAAWDGKGTSAHRALTIELDRAVGELEAERQKMREVFAAARDWRVSARQFSLEQLRTGRRSRRWEYRPWEDRPWREWILSGVEIDHPDFFWTASPDNRPVAIVSHTYYPWDKVTAFAAKERLLVERLDDSWYFPLAGREPNKPGFRANHTIAAVFTRPPQQSISATNALR